MQSRATPNTDIITRLTWPVSRLPTRQPHPARSRSHAVSRPHPFTHLLTVAQRLPERVVQEDADLLMYYDNALMRSEKA